MINALTALFVCSCVFFFVATIRQIADLIAHIGRYRRYLKLYPGSKQGRGRGQVWKYTK